MGTRKALDKAFKIINKTNLAKHLGISYQSINRWYDYDEMPCTEYNGKTMYSLEIQLITEDKVTVQDLCGFMPPPQEKELAKRLLKKT